MNRPRVRAIVATFVLLFVATARAIAGSPNLAPTSTPIKYLVVIFDENNSFDHYFGTYPNAANLPDEPAFTPLPGTPGVNGYTSALLTRNQNSAQPFRLDRSQSFTCDNVNHYSAEQSAYDNGLADKFIEFTSPTSTVGCPDIPNLPMGYYDGNTVTALWNYAQHYAMSDNFFGTEYGTTVMGHLNLISGQTHGATAGPGSISISKAVVNGSVIGNINPAWDDCGTPSTSATAQMSGLNVGNLLTDANVTWGWFYADFAAVSFSGGIPTCDATYNGHYDPFLYYQSTSNPQHLPPSSVSAIGTNADQANHNYALTDFWNAVANGNLPQVSFLKASSDETGHPQDSGPLSEQQFLVNTINRLQKTPFWSQMAIIISYDDSDGWYDHVMAPTLSPSSDPANDTLAGAGLCGVLPAGAYNDRCGYGPRLPMLVISPWAKTNYVDHALNDQTSILRLIENNWGLPQIGDQSLDAKGGSLLGLFNFNANVKQNPNYLTLDPNTGELVSKPASYVGN
jgi:phospholipase C